MRKVVIDTNVLVSAMLSINGTPAKIISMALDGELSVCYNSDILLEYNTVLRRPKFNLNDRKIQSVVGAIIESGVEFTPEASDFQMTDESDRKFYDLYSALKVILITGNLKHYPEEDLIMIPADFMGYVGRKERELYTNKK